MHCTLKCFWFFLASTGSTVYQAPLGYVRNFRSTMGSRSDHSSVRRPPASCIHTIAKILDLGISMNRRKRGPQHPKRKNSKGNVLCEALSKHSANRHFEPNKPRMDKGMLLGSQTGNDVSLHTGHTSRRCRLSLWVRRRMFQRG